MLIGLPGRLFIPTPRFTKLLKTLWGLPAHPVYVHFPIAFFTLASLLVALAAGDGKSRRVNRFLEKFRLGTFDFESLSFFSLILGCGMGGMAILSGLALVEGWKNLPKPHGPLGLAAVGCYLILLVLRWFFGRSLYGRRLRFLYYALNFLGALLVILAGYKGGELHYS